MVRWVVQNNLIAENDLSKIKNVCDKIGVELLEVKVIPFSTDLPELIIDDKINIYYGSTTFMNNIYKKFNSPIGLFYDSKLFTMENYLNKWKEHMLSSESKIILIKDIFNIGYTPDDIIFLRPNGDGKEFDGQVTTISEAWNILNNHIKNDNRLSLNSKILVGPAYNIHKEWRNYIVDGKIVTSSLYRKNFKLSKSATDIPQDMLDFVNARLKEYQPHKNFAIDIASTHDGTYYIIECGCLNSVGFYSCDIDKLITSITESYN